MWKGPNLLIAVRLLKNWGQGAHSTPRIWYRDRRTARRRTARLLGPLALGPFEPFSLLVPLASWALWPLGPLRLLGGLGGLRPFFALGALCFYFDSGRHKNININLENNRIHETEK